MTVKTPITLAYGDGIGPEIMRATVAILEAAKARITTEVIEVGEKIYLEGYTSGISNQAWESLKRTRVLLKGPITTPQGTGYKSLNVTLRKTLDLYANVRPCTSYAPYIPAKCSKMDLIIIRENEEDTYSGIEYRLTDEVYECIKLITRPGCERIIQYAFEHAKKTNRKKVTCLSKDNIMKMTDGLFHDVFNEIATQYPDIQHEHLIVDIGTALIATEPQRFDVIVTLNLYGDIISDVAAQVAGSVGLAGSANIGNQMAMFEAIHGSAPDIAGKDVANPSGLLQAAIQMLIHIDQPDIATLIENAWLKTIEEGIHTGDIFSQYSKKKVGTQAFAQAVIDRFGQTPNYFQPVSYESGAYTKIVCYGEKPSFTSEKSLVGVDISIDNTPLMPINDLAAQLTTKLKSKLKLIVITSRGLKIWPDHDTISPYLGQWCCRFQSDSQSEQLRPILYQEIIDLLTEMSALDLKIIKTENLYTFDGKLGFSLAQGQ